jgi:hypothetical protein
MAGVIEATQLKMHSKRRNKTRLAISRKLRCENQEVWVGLDAVPEQG